MKEVLTLSSAEVGQTVEIKDLGGTWKVLIKNDQQVRVKNTASNVELPLSINTQLK